MTNIHLQQVKSIGLKTTLLAAMISLAACGGGGGDGYYGGGSTNNGGSQGLPSDGIGNDATNIAQILSIGQSKASLNAGSEDTIDFTIRTLNQNGGIIPNAAVNIEILDAANSGASLTTKSNLTSDTTGKITTTLQLNNSSLSNRLNRSITLKISSGNTIQNLVIPVQGTTIDISADGISIDENSSAKIKVLAKDATGGSIIGAKVRLVDVSGNPITGLAEAITSSIGEAAFEVPFELINKSPSQKMVILGQLYVGSDDSNFQRSSSNITLTALTKNNDFVATSNNSIPAEIGKPIPLSVAIKTDSRAKLEGQFVSFATSNGSIQQEEAAVSNIRFENGVWIGNASTNLIGGVAGIATVSAQFGSSVIYINQQLNPGAPSVISLQSESAVLTPGSSTKVIALVKDVKGSPVPNTKVAFKVEQDTSSTGKLSAPTALTDQTGRATIIYTAGAAQTLGNGVVINATASNAKYPTPVYSDKLKLTVSTQSAYITLSQNKDILKIAGQDTYYFKQFSASVVDTSGNPVTNQKVSVSLALNKFVKGQFVWVRQPYYDDTFTLAYRFRWARVEKDRNGNIIQTYYKDCPSNEFANPIAILSSDNKILDTKNANFVTDDEGKFDFKIRYGRNYSNWLQVLLNVSTTVSTKENMTALAFVPPVSEDDVDDLDGKYRPDRLSPYGEDVSTCDNYK